MTTLYGIPNCDTVKKARAWLAARDVPYQFHDFRSDGMDETKVRSWISSLGWEAVVNKRSTTWRELDETAKAEMDASRAVAAIVMAPTLVKRPVLEHDGALRVGFNAKTYEEVFA